MIADSNKNDLYLLSFYVGRSIVLPIVGGTLGLSVIIIIAILLIIIVTSVSKCRARGTSLALPPSTSEDDIEMKPNSVYGLRSTNASEHIVTKPNEVYGITSPAELSHEQTYEYVNP